MQLGAVGISKYNIICAIGNDSGEIISKTISDIKTPDETITLISEYFKPKHVKGIGVGLSEALDESFDNFDFLDELKKEIKSKIALDTYANLSLLGELNFGSCKGLENCIYATCHNIVEIGVIKDGKLLPSATNKNKAEVQNLAQTIMDAVSAYSPQKLVIESNTDTKLIELIQRYIESVIESKFENIEMPMLKEDAVIKGALAFIRKLI